MIPEIDFIQPENLQQALQSLAQFMEQACPIAGGTDIIPGFHINSQRFRQIKVLIDIGQLPELTTIEHKEDGLHIGAAATFTQIGQHPLITENFPLLAQAAQKIGSVQIRNRATIAGNFVNNAPCADSVPPLLVYDAQIVLQSLNNTRQMPLEKFLLKPYQTQLQADELVKEIILPVPGQGYRGKFYKLGRRRGVAISRITLAILLKLDGTVIDDFRLASGAVTPIGMRLHDLEKMIIGQSANEDLFKEIAIASGQKILEITGLRWSTAYKLPVVQQMIFALLKQLTSSNA